MKKRLLSFLLSFSICATFSVPSVATNCNTKENPLDVLATNSDVAGTTIYEISHDARTNAFYYFESTDRYTLTMTLAENGYFDYAILYADSNAVLYDSYKIDDVSVSNYESIFAYEKSLVLEKEPAAAQSLTLTAAPSTQSAYRGGAGTFAWSIPEEDKEKIDRVIQEDEGHPAAYEDAFQYRRTQGDLVGEIYETLTYGYGRTVSELFVAGTAIGVIAAVFGLPQATIISLAVFAWDAANAVYTLVDSTRFSKYDVYIIYWRKAYINDEYVRLATWQVRWDAYVGGSSASLTAYVDNKGDEYSLSNYAYLQRAFNDYTA